MSKAFRSSARSVVSINIHLLMSAGCAAIAWAIWPQAPEWWGLGVISIILAGGAFVGLIKALREMTALHRKTRALDDYTARGGAPKPARMANLSDLERAGMLDG